MVIGAVQAIHGFSVLVSKQNHVDLSLTALVDTLKRFYMKHGVFQEQNISNTAKAKVDKCCATQSQQLQEHEIHEIRAGMEVQMDKAEKVSTPIWRQFQVHLDLAWQAATKWSYPDQRWAKERLEHEIYQVTPVKYKTFNQLLQCHKQQLLQEVGTKATSPSSTLANNLVQIKTVTEEEVSIAATMTSEKSVEFLNHQSHAETEATTWSTANADHIANQLETDLGYYF